ncbi:hypothetical protein KUCAC02_026161 [Chaenocephalus aceratus]|uniref:Uncharacterized protein n=1 Tax=Chaenocephalus aceratus TaxID=36190 RepID=A0ACB9VX58_CHAAC|nr:hypothetical protein KUCAC02_026161 [Chaenocephalus aceratus]
MEQFAQTFDPSPLTFCYFSHQRNLKGNKLSTFPHALLSGGSEQDKEEDGGDLCGLVIAVRKQIEHFVPLVPYRARRISWTRFGQWTRWTRSRIHAGGTTRTPCSSFAALTRWIHLDSRGRY